MACTPLAIDGDFVASALDFVDCQARGIGAGGYQALAAPGSIMSLALTGLLTLFVAGYGFRMLMGETPSVRDGVAAFAKIAFVLALATAWGPYRTLVYDVTMRGPAELAGTIGAASGIPGPGELIERLGLVDKALVELNDLGSGRRGSGQEDTRGRQVIGSDRVIVEATQGKPNPFEPFAFGAARIFFLTGAIGSIGAVRLVAGVLLALGPLFIAFLLFDATRGLFVGWVRGLAGAFLGSIAVSLLLAAQLAACETWIADLLTRRLADEPIAGAAVELVVATIVFDLLLIAGLAASIRVAAGFRLPDWQRSPVPVRSEANDDRILRGTGMTSPLPAVEPRSRATAVANGVAAMQRREQAAATGERGAASDGNRARSAGGGSRAAIALAGRNGRGAVDMLPSGATPLGHTFQRRSHGRVSASADRRDSRS